MLSTVKRNSKWYYQRVFIGRTWSLDIYRQPRDGCIYLFPIIYTNHTIFQSIFWQWSNWPINRSGKSFYLISRENRLATYILQLLQWSVIWTTFLSIRIYFRLFKFTMFRYRSIYVIFGINKRKSVLSKYWKLLTLWSPVSSRFPVSFLIIG